MRFSPVLPFAALLFTASCTHSNCNPDVVLQASQPFMSMPVKTTHISGNISEISGVGGNILAIAGKEGTTLLDTGVEPRQDRLDTALGGLHAARVTQVIDSHYHFDHTGGNYHYGNQGATIIAQENVRARLSKPQTLDFFQKTFPAAPDEALPSVTFVDRYEAKAGGHTLELRHPPKPAHTDGDIFIKIADANVIFTGDIYFNKLYPFIDYGVGGNIDGMIAATDEVIAASDAKTKIVPGHGAISNIKELKAYRRMLASISKKVHALIAAGKTEDQVVAAKPTKEFDAVWGKGLFTGEQFTRIVYRGLAK